jgi:8-oxo-dGTP pyrophosphatase MutT (NUDIX family)
MPNHHVAEAIAARLGVALAPPTNTYLPFIVDGQAMGRITPARAARLADFAEIFRVDGNAVTFSAHCADAESRNAALAQVARQLAQEGALSAWRDELYPIAAAPRDPAPLQLERAAARYFGVHTCAVHVNGVVNTPAGIRIWFARRSFTKAIDPGLLDNLVGGGIAAGSTAPATLVKEAWEEAGIAPSLAAEAQLKGTVHIRRDQPDGLQHETILVHDLLLPATFVPANQDGEAVEHRLVDVGAAAGLIANTEGRDVVTADASLVALDFLLRERALSFDASLRTRLVAMLGGDP